MPTEAIHKTLCHPERRIDLRVSESYTNQIDRSRVEHGMTNTFVYNSDIHHHRNGGFMKDFIMRIKKSAFTLAEVLITLGIIGVVAALTLPTLIQNHQKQVYVTGLKKAYSNIQNAFSKAMLDEGITDWKQSECYSSSNYEACLNNLKKQFKIVSTTPMEGPTPGGSIWGYNNVLADFTTSDGVMYKLYDEWVTDFGCMTGFPVLKYFFVDVNGLKGPNQFGRDKFVFEVDYDKNKIEPEGSTQTWGPEAWKNCTTEKVNAQSGTNILFCAAKVIIEGKMNY